MSDIGFCYINNFVIDEIFCNSVITLLSTAKEAYLEQNAQKYLLNCLIIPLIFSYTNSPGKVSKLLYIFSRICIGTPLFNSNEFIIPGNLGGQLCYFSAV